jgi:hypothetical protein
LILLNGTKIACSNTYVNYKEVLMYLRSILGAVAVCCMPFSGANAATVAVDGIKQAGEYAGGESNGEESLLWWNSHESIYTKAAGNMNTLYWEIDNGGGSSNFTLNVFAEVPDYARRMIWVKDCKYKGPGSDSDCNAIPDEYLDAYEEGSHHNDVKMDYKTQTKSEYFEFNGADIKIKWQDEDNNGTSDDFTWATSREYLLENNICTTELCLQFDATASIEMMWLGLADEQAALDIIASITDMELHLSDEARGIPAVVPVPAAAWLFISALGGLVVAKRKQLKA